MLIHAEGTWPTGQVIKADKNYSTELLILPTPTETSIWQIFKWRLEGNIWTIAKLTMANQVASCSRFEPNDGWQNNPYCKYWGFITPITIIPTQRSELQPAGCGAFFARVWGATPRTGSTAEAVTEKAARGSLILDFELMTTSWTCVFTWTGSCSTVIPPLDFVCLFLSSVFPPFSRLFLHSSLLQRLRAMIWTEHTDRYQPNTAEEYRRV